MNPEQIEEMRRDMDAGTPGPWRARAMGGDSVVLADTHKHHRFSEGYGAYPVAIPRTYYDDEDEKVRVDYQAAGFRHTDARRIARVPQLEAEVLRLHDRKAEAAKDAERFWNKVQIKSDGECWPWLGAQDGKTRGQFWIDGKTERAPRVAWSLHWGAPFPENMLACHTCDNPNCCNPHHIWPGTMQQNILDATRKGRVKPDEMHKAHRCRGKTHCPQGHPYSGDNLYVTKRGTRECRICRSAARSRYDKRARTAMKGSDQ